MSIETGHKAVKLSVIIPCFNESRYIEKNLKMLEADGPVPYTEVVIVDNASSDDTVGKVNLVASGGYSLPVRVVSEPLPGVSRAKNTGARHASGEFFLFLDADNYVAKSFLQEVREILSRGSVHMATISTFPARFGCRSRIIFWTLDFLKRTTKRPFGKSLVSRKLFTAVGGFNESIVLGENLDFLVRARSFAISSLGKNSVAHIKKPIYCSLRRFRKDGYIKTLFFWFRAYIGNFTLPYQRLTNKSES